MATVQVAGAAAEARGEAEHGESSRWVAWILAVAPVVMVVVYWLAASRERRVYLLEDDAFYYFGVARSIAHGDGSTFAGVAHTNGYHPFWLAVLIPVTWAFDEVGRLVLGVLLLQGALWVGTVREGLRIGRAVGSWPVAAVGLGAYAVLPLLTGHLALNGMESGLALYLLVLAVRLIVCDDGGDVRTTVGGLRVADLRLGVVLAGLCVTRLDAVFALLPLGVLLMLAPPRRLGALVRRGIALGGPSAVSLGTYMAVNWLVFDTTRPVSGESKSLGDPGPDPEALWDFLRMGQIAGVRVWIGAITVAMVAGTVVLRSWRREGALGRLASVTLALTVGEALMVAYLGTQMSFTFFFPWYHYQLPVMALGAAMCIAAWLETTRAETLARFAVVPIGLVLVAYGLNLAQEATEDKGDSVESAEFVTRELPPDAVLAMGDRAGYFGFLANRPLLHLEGLVADVEYLHQLEAGQGLQRLVDEGVDFYVHDSRPGLPTDVAGEPCWRFAEPPYTRGPSYLVTVCERDLVYVAGDPPGDPTFSNTQNELAIWRFRPELNQGGAVRA